MSPFVAGNARAIAVWSRRSAIPAILLSLALSEPATASPLLAAPPRIDSRAGDRPSAIVAGDIDRDGRVDLAVTNSGFDRGGVSILLGNGDGTFGTTVRAGAPRFGLQLTTGDLNADGRADLVMGRYESTLISTLLGNGDGTFADATDVEAGAGPRSTEVTDVNLDGREDLVVANYLSASISVLLGNGDGTFGARSDFTVGIGPRSLSVADLNGDRSPDVVVTHENGPGTVSVLLGRGDGTFASPAEVGPGQWAVAVAIADLDADGLPDLAVNHLTHIVPATSNGVSILFGNGDGTFRPGPTFVTGGEPKTVFIRDIDQDGRRDVLMVRNSLGNGVLSVFPGNGDGSFGTRADISLGGAGIEGASLDDVDGDGQPDLVTLGGDEWAGSVCVLIGAGDGTFAPPAAFGCGGDARAAAIADFDGDARVDLAVIDNEVLPILLLFGNGSSGGRLALSSVDTDVDRVELRWSGRGATTLAAGVYRRDASSNWTLLGSAVPEGVDVLRFEDRSLVPGARYWYRLGWREPTREVFTPETELVVPIPNRVSLESVRPNPTADAIRVAFTLVDAASATLEVMDVSGRRLASRDVGSLGPGRHVLSLDDGPRLASGVYLVRLRHRGQAWVLRAAVIR